MGRVVYMDNHATTPVDPRVLAAMLPYFGERFGNAASRTHQFGWDAEEAVDCARRQTAALIHAKPREVIFTSGATESNNLALKGAVEFRGGKGAHVITAVTEHPSVLDTCKALERSGDSTVSYLRVDRCGLVDPADVRRAITNRTVLISIMYANNEIGSIHPLKEIGAIAKERGILFHTDATQGVGKLPLDVEALGVDLLSLTAHKVYGPKGCGALYVRSNDPRTRLAPMTYGGGHERGMRSGTLNVPGIVGLGMACEVAGAEMNEEHTRVLRLRERLHQQIVQHLGEVYLNGHPTHRLSGNLNLSFGSVDGESLLMSLHDVAVSSGSACTSANLEPSHVLKALGIKNDRAQSSIRFGLGRFNTEEEVDYVAERVVSEVQRLRNVAPAHDTRRRACH